MIIKGMICTQQFFNVIFLYMYEGFNKRMNKKKKIQKSMKKKS